MPDKSLPTVAPFALPAAALRAPLAAPAEARKERTWADSPDIHALCELLEPAISAAIARKARQRRYAP